MTEEAAVLGAGNMGTALAQVVASNGHHVRLWSIEHDVLEDVRDRRLNIKYLEGVTLHKNIEAVWDLEKAVTGARLLIVSVPSQIVRGLTRDIAHLVTKQSPPVSHLKTPDLLCQCASEGSSFVAEQFAF